MTFTEKYMKPFEGEGKSSSEVFRLGINLAIEDLGFDNLVPLLPRKVNVLKKVYEWDKYFNVMPFFSLSQKVSVLKEVARRVCREVKSYA